MRVSCGCNNVCRTCRYSTLRAVSAPRGATPRLSAHDITSLFRYGICVVRDSPGRPLPLPLPNLAAGHILTEG